MKPTTAQNAELHIAMSGILSLLSAVATATYQAGTSNHLDIGQIAGFAIGTLTLSLGASFISVMHAMMSAPQAAQAMQDTENDVTSWLDTRLAALEKCVLAAVARTGAPTPQSVTTQAVPSSVPTPIPLPDGASPVPPRVSVADMTPSA